MVFKKVLKLAIGLCLCAPQIILAAKKDGPSYSDRPSIESVNPAPIKLDESAMSNWHQNNWPRLRESTLVWSLFLLELHKEPLFFLGRDAEYAYDVSRLVTQGTDDYNRVHLINISRSSVNSEQVVNYSEEEIFKISGGKKPVFVDTVAWDKTIQRGLISRYETEKPNKILTSTIISGQTKTSMPVIALSFIEGLMSSTFMNSSVIAELYEHLPHYTGTAFDYEVLEDGRYSVLTKDVKKAEAQDALVLMKDLKHFVMLPETQKRTKALLKNFSSLLGYLRAENDSFDWVETYNYLWTEWAIPLEDVLYDIQQMSKASYGGFKVKRIKALDTLLDESIGFKYNLLPKGVYSLAELSFNPSDLSRVEGIIEWLIGSHDYFSYLEVGTDFRGEEFESVSGKPLTYEDRDLILLQLFELFKTDVRWAQADFSDEIDFEELSSGDYEETHLEILVSGIRKNSKLWKAFRAMVSEHKPAWSKRDDFKLANNGGLSILKRIPSTKNSAGACKSSLRTGIH